MSTFNTNRHFGGSAPSPSLASRSHGARQRLNRKVNAPRPVNLPSLKREHGFVYESMTASPAPLHTWGTPSPTIQSPISRKDSLQDKDTTEFNAPHAVTINTKNEPITDNKPSGTNDKASPITPVKSPTAPAATISPKPSSITQTSSASPAPTAKTSPPSAPRAWGNVPKVPASYGKTSSSDFPTAAEAAALEKTSKNTLMDNKSYIELMTSDSTKLRWDEMADDEDNFSVDTMIFEDGTEIHIDNNDAADTTQNNGAAADIEPPGNALISPTDQGPVSPNERFADDYDRSYPPQWKRTVTTDDVRAPHTGRYDNNNVDTTNYDNHRRNSHFNNNNRSSNNAYNRDNTTRYQRSYNTDNHSYSNRPHNHNNDTYNSYNNRRRSSYDNQHRRLSFDQNNYHPQQASYRKRNSYGRHSPEQSRRDSSSSSSSQHPLRPLSPTAPTPFQPSVLKRPSPDGATAIATAPIAPNATGPPSLHSNKSEEGIANAIERARKRKEEQEAEYIAAAERARQKAAALAEKQELEKKERERQQNEQREKERLEKERSETEQREKEQLEKEQREKDRLEKEQAEKARIDKEQLEKKQVENEQVEEKRVEEEHFEKEQLEKMQDEKELSEAEQRLEQEREKTLKLKTKKSKKEPKKVTILSRKPTSATRAKKEDTSTRETEPKTDAERWEQYVSNVRNNTATTTYTVSSNDWSSFATRLEKKTAQEMDAVAKTGHERRQRGLEKEAEQPKVSTEAMGTEQNTSPSVEPKDSEHTKVLKAEKKVVKTKAPETEPKKAQQKETLKKKPKDNRQPKTLTEMKEVEQVNATIVDTPSVESPGQPTSATPQEYGIPDATLDIRQFKTRRSFITALLRRATGPIFPDAFGKLAEKPKGLSFMIEEEPHDVDIIAGNSFFPNNVYLSSGITSQYERVYLNGGPMNNCKPFIVPIAKRAPLNLPLFF